jgi:hypothetical protein
MHLHRIYPAYRGTQFLSASLHPAKGLKTAANFYAVLSVLPPVQTRGSIPKGLSFYGKNLRTVKFIAGNYKQKPNTLPLSGPENEHKKLSRNTL